MLDLTAKNCSGHVT